MDTPTTNLRFLAKTPSLAAFKFLRTDAGWPLPPDDVIETSLNCTLFGMCIESDEGQTIGMGRVVGDGGIQLFITEVIVCKEWQNKGLGTKIMQGLMEYVHSAKHKGTFVGLFSAFGRHEFYEKFGFTIRPTETLGPGMMLSKRKPNS